MVEAVVDFDALSCKELIACPKNAHVSASTQASVSKSGDSKSHSTNSDNKESISQSSSSSSGSSAESSKEIKDGADSG